jgi:hypothetical protein
MKPTQLLLALGFGLLLCLQGCRVADNSDTGTRSRVSMQRPTPAGRDDGRVFAVLINGGGSAERNYRSHILHIRRLRRLLLESGVPDAHIAIFASDGADPEPDLAIIDRRAEDDWWLIEPTLVGRAFQPKPELVDSTVEGAVLQPATRASISAWFESMSELVETGDTLLLYVTDHGSKDPVNLNNNAIVLWNERLVVDDLIRLLAPLRARAQVVMLMSQCFSGAFARAMRPRVDGGTPDGQVCGYFASTADRFAYGCYAENRGRDNVGYSFRVLDALRRTAELESAHHRVLLTDRTPDVPHKTSDAYLLSLLTVAARARGVAADTLADSLLEQAWADELHYKDLFAEIDAIGETYGSFSPRSLAELGDRLENLPGLSRSLRSSSRQWDQLSRELVLENYSSFLEAKPDWRDVADIPFLESLPDGERNDMLALLLAELREHAGGSGERWESMLDYRRIGAEARSGSYRMQVRLGAALRIRTLLVRIAGLVYLDRVAGGEQRAAFERLEECEHFELPGRAPRLQVSRDQVEAYPSLVKEMELISALLPGWLGVEYRPLDSATRLRLDALPGAAVVTRVHSYSPASEAGLVVGDIILGPPGEHFRRRARLREWVTTSLVDQVRTLELLRDDRLLQVAIRVGSVPDGP